MVKIDHVQTFIQVARAGSFSAAARQTGVPLSTISLQIGKLEEALGVRLLKRSTRAISLTEEGAHLLENASGALDQLVRVLSDMDNQSDAFRGTINLTAPADFPTSGLAKAITSFKELHPNVHIKILLTNAKLDFVKENIDIAVRVSGAGNQDAIQRKLMDFEWVFCANHTWVSANGRPETIAQITNFIAPPTALRDYLQGTILGSCPLPHPAIEVENSFLAKDLVISGFGVGLLPKGLCAAELENGEIVPFLEDSVLASTRLTLTFPTRADMVPRVRAFADHISKVFSEPV